MKKCIFFLFLCYTLIAYNQECSPYAGDDVTICGSSTVHLHAENVGNGYWSAYNDDVQIYPVWLFSTSYSDPNAVCFIPQYVGNYCIIDFVWTDDCNSYNPPISVTDTVVVTFVRQPLAVISTETNESVCGNELEVYADTTTSGWAEGHWESNYSEINFDDIYSINPTILVDNPELFGDSASINVRFYWIMDYMTCVDIDSIDVHFYQFPDAIVQNDTSICGNEFVLNSIFSIPETSNYCPSGQWVLYDGPIGCNVNIVELSDTTTKVVVDKTGEYSFLWTEYNSNMPYCVSKDTVKIIFLINEINAGSDITISDCDSAQLFVETQDSEYTFEWRCNNDEEFYSDIQNPIVCPEISSVYFVTVTDLSTGCKTSDYVLVFVQDLMVNIGNDTSLTCGETIQFNNVFNNFTGDAEVTYSWLPSIGLNNPDIINPICTITDTITYILKMETDNGCIAYDSITINLSPKAKPDICFVTVNENNKCEINWAASQSIETQVFYVYNKDESIFEFEKIDTLLFQNSIVFIDESSKPFLSQEKYKISYKDMCGLESYLSEEKKSIFLGINQISDNSVSLEWSSIPEYVICKIYIYRGNTPDELIIIDSLPCNAVEYTDNSIIVLDEYLYYKLGLKVETNCMNSKSLKNIFSNIATNDPNFYEGSSSEILGLNKFKIFPNPGSKILYFKADFKIDKISVFDSHSKKLHSIALSDNYIDISGLTPGTYYIIAEGENNRITKKLSIQ
ncbi:MAG: T9SS type A sorting domain-containing protein [Bacteroidales bacterium]|nr:T9SS type A sorting domain-containing protein [Bacteroidales bacterium]